MGYGIGSLLSVVVSVFARSVGLDRDRAFYPTVLIVVASYYVVAPISAAAGVTQPPFRIDVDFVQRSARAITLRGTNDELAITFVGAPASSVNLARFAEWYED